MRERRFVAIDGESYTDEDGHKYVLLASSLGEYIFDSQGLSSTECFQFLLSLRKRAKRYIFIAFGLNYDVNMMLRDVGRENLEKLWKEHRISWYSYNIEWIPGKWFSVSSKGYCCKIYDLFGFFQSSFVNALKKWDIPVQEDMQEMKQARSIFDATMKDKIIAYCIEECKALELLANKLKFALQETGLTPKSWVGAGSIASSLMQKHNVKQYHVSDFDWDREVLRYSLHAYFGGRVELFKQGIFDTVSNYDIRSAYPYQALSLPSLKGGRWTKLKRYNPEKRYALWRVSWDLPRDTIVSPFPFRHKGNIYYPLTGEGIYHANEVRIALKYYGTRIRILDGYSFSTSSDTSPFSFIREEFKHRAKLKEQNHPGEKVIKLGLNALYGKLAQGIGYRGKLPPFQSFYWAGFITSGTRARILDYSIANAESLIMVATDGLFFDSNPKLVCSNTLGGLEYQELRDVFVAQAGVYQATKSDGTTYAKSRGFFVKEIDFDSLRKGFLANGSEFTANYNSHRFVGLGSCVSRGNFEYWRTWHDSIRNLCLYPNRKFIGKAESGGKVIRHVPMVFDDGCFSAIYKPKQAELSWSPELLEFIEGSEQPLRDY